MRRIQHPDGIQAHDIYSVFEDSRHYLWFTTDGGIWRFDGKNYKNYTTEHGLPDNVVFQFFEDHQHRAWFSSYSGKLAYIRNDSVFSLPCNEALAQLKKVEIPAAIYVDTKHAVYISYFRSNDYVKISPPYKAANIQVEKNLGNSEFFAIAIENKGILPGSTKLYNGTKLRRMTFLKNGQALAEVADSASSHGGMRVSVSKQYDDTYLVSADNFLSEYKNGKVNKITSVNYSILSALKDTYNNYWISTIDGGLFLYRSDDTTFSHPENYLSGKTVGKIMQDHEGAFWITTLTDGVFYMPHMDVLLANAASGISDNVTYVFADTINKLVFCADPKGNLFVRSRNKTLKTINCNTRPDKPNQVKIIIPLASGEYLLFGRNSLRLNTKTGRINYLKDLEGISAAISDGVGTTWASRQVSLLRIDSRENKVWAENDFNAKINSIYAADDSTLWLGTERGLLVYNHKRHALQAIPANIPDKGVISITRFSKNKNLVIYKSDGILVVDDKLTVVNSLRVDVQGYSIRHVTKDAQGNIWISTNKGVLRIDRELHIRNLQEQHGLPSNIVNAIGTDDHTVYVASDKGLIQFPISKNFFNVTPPDIYLKSVIINNEFHSSDTVFRLNYKQNFIKVLVTPINYRISDDIVTYYKMDGVDQDWKATKNDEIEYTTLPPGTYRLVIYAVNNDQVPSAKRLTLAFAIAPPFWQTWWFITTVIILAVFLIGILFKWRLALVRRRSRERANLQAQLGQMEMQALRSQMNPHFIFNAINSIQHYILTNEPVLANKFLVKFSKLIRNILEQSKQELIPLKEEIETLRFYIEIEALRFEDSFSYRIEVADNIDLAGIRIPPLILQPYVENAIWHGLLLKKGKKELLVKIHQKSGNLIVEIDDNGIGRQAARAFEKKETKKKSLGMKITQNRLELLGKSLGMNIQVNLVDKSNASGEAEGTTVILKKSLLLSQHA